MSEANAEHYETELADAGLSIRSRAELRHDERRDRSSSATDWYSAMMPKRPRKKLYARRIRLYDPEWAAIAPPFNVPDHVKTNAKPHEQPDHTETWGDSDSAMRAFVG